MSIMNFFKEQKPAGQTDPNSNGNVPTTGQPGKENLSQNPPSKDQTGKMPGTDPVAENPLDTYQKMFENAAKNEAIEVPTFSLDPKVVRDVSSKMDFVKGINPETLQKATSGDTNALLDVIRTVGQNSYRAALEHSTALTDKHLSQRSEFESKTLERGVNKKLTESALASSAPNYTHPVVKAELNRIASQIAAANPDASPQEVASTAQKYLNDLYSALNPQTNKAEDKNGSGETDWTKYLTGTDN